LRQLKRAWRGAGEQGDVAHRRNRLHSSFGTSLGEQVQVCVVDGVFEAVELFHWITLELPLVADSFPPTAVNIAN
jgi:hypothetical protein